MMFMEKHDDTLSKKTRRMLLVNTRHTHVGLRSTTEEGSDFSLLNKKAVLVICLACRTVECVLRHSKIKYILFPQKCKCHIKLQWYINLLEHYASVVLK